MPPAPSIWTKQQRASYLKALKEFRPSNKPSWNQQARLAERVEPLFELGLVTAECGVDADAERKVDALGTVIDRLLYRIKGKDAKDTARQGRPDFLPGCLLLRRPDCLDIVTKQKLTEELRKTKDGKNLHTAKPDTLRDLIATEWEAVYGERKLTGGGFKSHQEEDLFGRMLGELEAMESEHHQSAVGADGAKLRDPSRREQVGDEPRAAGGEERPQPAKPGVFNAADVYERIEPKHLEEAFWWRDSTQRYITELASQPGLTILAGADGKADVGEPKHDLAAAALLKQALKNTTRAANEADRSIHIARTAALFADRSPSYIGSIIRGLYEVYKPRAVPIPKVDGHLDALLSGLVTPGAEHESREVEAFVSGSIVRLGLTFRDRGKPVAITTAHYDDDVCSEFEKQTGALPRVIYLSSTEADAALLDLDDLPIFCLHRDPNAEPSGRLMLSELDLFLPSRTAEAGASSWVTSFRHLFQRRSSLIVGTELRSPGLVAALAGTKNKTYPRYALLLADSSERSVSAAAESGPPPGEHAYSLPTSSWMSTRISDRAPDAASPPDAQARFGRSLYLNAFAARFVHLGIVPIIADFPCQVPRFLREVSLCADLGEDAYESYKERCLKWWTGNRAALGFEAAPGSVQAAELQEKSYAALGDMRNEIVGKLAKLSEDERATGHVRPGERVSTEMWIRNPTRRELFLWASSEGYWRPIETAPAVSLRVTGDVTQVTFREGRTIWREIADGAWRYHVSMPLTLPDEYPWYGLQVGVVNVKSTEEDGGLAYIADAEQGEVLEAKQEELVALVPATLPS